METKTKDLTNRVDENKVKGKPFHPYEVAVEVLKGLIDKPYIGNKEDITYNSANW